MKAILCLIVLVASAFGQSSAPVIPVDQQNAAKAKALIDSAIQALGGDAYLNIKSITQEGRTYSFHLGNPNSVGVVFYRTYEYPDKERIELTKKRDIAQVFTGIEGYEITYKGATPIPEKDLSSYIRRRQYSLDWVLRKWIHQPGIALFYEGQTVANQKAAEQVSIIDSHNQSVTLYFDIDTHLPVKKTFSWRDPTDSQRNVEDEVWDNYKPVGGVMTPFTTARYYNGDMSNQRFLNSVTYNQPVDESKFQVNFPNRPEPRK